MLNPFIPNRNHTMLCNNCDCKIYEGEDYYIIDKSAVCEDCAENILNDKWEGLSLREKAELFEDEHCINQDPNLP